MGKRLWVKGAGTTILQIALYALLLQAGTLVAGLLELPLHKGVDRGLSLSFSLLFFSVVVFGLNLISALFPQKPFPELALCGASLLYMAGWAENMDRHPYLVVYLVTIGLLCLWIKRPLDHRGGRGSQRWHA